MLFELDLLLKVQQCVAIGTVEVAQLHQLVLVKSQL